MEDATDASSTAASEIEAERARVLAQAPDLSLVEAVESIDLALSALDEHSEDAPEHYFELLYTRARLNFAAGRFVEASEELRLALRVAGLHLQHSSPASSDAWALLARASVLAGRCELSLEAVEQLWVSQRTDTAMRQLARIVGALAPFEAQSPALPGGASCQATEQELRARAQRLVSLAAGAPRAARGPGHGE